jgi:hypothetical protein
VKGRAAAPRDDAWASLLEKARETSWAFGLVSIEIRGFLERMATLESVRRHHARLRRGLPRPSRGIRRHVRRAKAAARAAGQGRLFA